ncbi:MAG: PqqD family peptide modification chaperone [Pseudobdellovibrio sp.]
MKTLNFDPNKNYVASKTLISRLNQDNTVIIMKTDVSEVFYKINGLAALIWNLYKSPSQPAALLQLLQNKFSQQPSEQIQNEFNAFMEQIISLQLLDQTQDAVPSTKADEASTTFAKIPAYQFGKLSEYSLAQIESEVLNESIYLDVFAGSDLRLKKDVAPLQNSLEKVLALDGISYLWNETAAAQAPTTNQIGLVAQQVATVMPDLVKKDAGTGLLAINYTKITPYLVESIKELKSIIDAQNTRITALEQELKKLKH